MIYFVKIIDPNKIIESEYSNILLDDRKKLQKRKEKKKPETNERKRKGEKRMGEK